jgi:hypothetical protein
VQRQDLFYRLQFKDDPLLDKDIKAIAQLDRHTIVDDRHGDLATVQRPQALRQNDRPPTTHETRTIDEHPARAAMSAAG